MNSGLILAANQELEGLLMPDLRAHSGCRMRIRQSLPPYRDERESQRQTSSFNRLFYWKLNLFSD